MVEVLRPSQTPVELALFMLALVHGTTSEVSSAKFLPFAVIRCAARFRSVLRRPISAWMRFFVLQIKGINKCAGDCRTVFFMVIITPTYCYSTTGIIQNIPFGTCHYIEWK